MAGLVDIDLGSVIKAGGQVLDNLFTSDEERATAKLKDKALDLQVVSGQLAINRAEAEHKSIFVAGWRPFIGWVGGCALAYKFIFYSLICWFWAVARAKGWIGANIPIPPDVDASQLYPIILGLLGLGGMRSYEGIKGVKTNSIRKPEIKKKKSGWHWPW